MGTSWFLLVRLCDRVYNFFLYDQYTVFRVITSRQIVESSSVQKYQSHHHYTKILQSSPVDRYQSHHQQTNIRVITSTQISVITRTQISESLSFNRYQSHNQQTNISVITSRQISESSLVPRYQSDHRSHYQANTQMSEPLLVHLLYYGEATFLSTSSRIFK